MIENSNPFTSKKRYAQFKKEFNTVKELNGRSCPFKRENETIDEELYDRTDKILPIIRPKISHNMDFSSESLTKDRVNLLNEMNYGEYTGFDNAMRSCYIKDTILDGKKVQFANSTNEKKISSGAYGSVVLYEDKDTGLPIASGKFVVDYKFQYNKNKFNTDMNFETVHEALIGLELVNKCKYLLPSYPSTYGMGYCDINLNSEGIEQSCTIINGMNISKDAPVVFIEYLNKSFTLKDFLAGALSKQKFSQQEILNNVQSLYLQIFNALNILYMMNGCYTHYDLHDDNILIRILDEEILMPIYVFGEDEILKEIKYLKTKYIAHIIDYGMSTFLSYETLSREFHQKSSKYFGKTVEEIRKYFIFGNDRFPDVFDSKKVDQVFDIYKIIGFSSYHYNNATENFPPKKEILRFFGVLYKIMLQTSSMSSYDLISNYLNVKADAERDDLFAKPKNFVSNITFNFLVEYLSIYLVIPSAKPLEIYNAYEISSNPLLKTLHSPICLNPGCDQGIIDQFIEVYSGNNSKNYNFFPVEFESLKLFLYKRRLDINNMLLSLSSNYANSENDTVNAIVTILLKDGKKYDFSFNFPQITKTQEMNNIMISYPDVAQILKGKDFTIYISETENYKNGKRIFFDNTVVDLEGVKYILYEQFSFPTFAW